MTDRLFAIENIPGIAQIEMKFSKSGDLLLVDCRVMQSVVSSMTIHTTHHYLINSYKY